MPEKLISVPLQHYLLLATLGAEYINYLSDLPSRTAEQEGDFGRLVRWEQWHIAADERGLTR